MSSADDRNKSADYVPEEDSTEMEVGHIILVCCLMAHTRKQLHRL